MTQKNSLHRKTASFAVANNALGTFHLVLSLGLWLSSFIVGLYAYPNPLALLISALLYVAATIRLFGIQHDCGHQSYFTNRRVNERVGVILGAFTGNPFYCMRYNHNKHHAYLGNLDRMEDHEVLTWTVSQWRAASPAKRLGYRLYRSPVSILLLGPIAVIVLRYRFPKNALKVGILDPLIQNILMFSLWGGIFFLCGWPGVGVLALGILGTVSIGTLMVYAGHNHENTYWAKSDTVQYTDAVLQGCSVIELGPIFDFITFNFAYHDLHHLNARIPAYRLKSCYRALESHFDSQKIGLIGMFATLRCKLWDEDLGCMVTFRDADTVKTFEMQPGE